MQSDFQAVKIRIHAGRFFVSLFLSQEMDQIQLLDKTFVPYLTEAEIQTTVKSLAARINFDYAGHEVVFLSILNGSFMFTSDLMKHITLPCEISFIKVSSYVGTQTSGRVDELIGLTDSLRDKHVLVVEDIVDTGITMDKILTLLRKQQTASLEVCSILFKKIAFQGKHAPKYYGYEIPDKFVVGYGLDYLQHGRNLPAIYQLKTEK